MRKKRIISLLITFCLVFCSLFSFVLNGGAAALGTTPACEEATQNVRNAILYDITSGRVLFSKNAEERISAASITKLVTACTALKYISKDTVFTVGTELNLVKPNSSRCFIYSGQRLTLEQLICGMLIPSGNDAAYTVAVNVAKIISGNSLMSDTNAVIFFCSLMNSYAKEIGAVNSVFANPEGWDSDYQYTTVNDLVKISLAAVNNELIRSVTSCAEKRLIYVSGENNTWINSNSLLNRESEYYYEGAFGLKTGTTVAAGRCLAAAAGRNGKQLLAIVMGCDTDATRYSSVIKMFDAGFVEFVPGDFDGDFEITASDARIALRVSVGIDTASAETLQRCDMDADGVVTAADARIILRLSVGIID